MTEPIKKEVLLYNDTVKIFFNSNARNRYQLEDGSSPVGVTTVLGILDKPGLMLWAMNEAIAHLKQNPKDYEGASKAFTKKSYKGLDVGTQVHTAIEKFLVEGHAEVINDAIKPFEAFTGWFNEVKPKVLATEQIIYSKKFNYCGTYDALLEINGKVVLCDIKTNNTSRSAPLGIYSEHFLQLGAYALAHHEENPEQKIDDVMVIRVGKDGILNTLRASELGLKLFDLENTFHHIIKTYQFVTPFKKTLTNLKEE